MPKIPPYKQAIPRIYRRGHMEVSLFSWVLCSQNLFPSLTVEDALQEWYKFFGINQDDYKLTTAVQTFTRMKEEALYKEKDEKDNKLD